MVKLYTITAPCKQAAYPSENVEKNKFEKRGEKNWNRLDLKVEFEVVIIIAEDEGFKKKLIEENEQ